MSTAGASSALDEHSYKRTGVLIKKRQSRDAKCMCAKSVKVASAGVPTSCAHHFHRPGAMSAQSHLECRVLVRCYRVQVRIPAGSKFTNLLL